MIRVVSRLSLDHMAETEGPVILLPGPSVPVPITINSRHIPSDFYYGS